MEAVSAYYNGHAFIPTKPVRAKKNQRAIVTILDEMQIDVSRDLALEAIEKTCGMFTGTGLSSEDYMARKEYEKSLER